MLNIPNFGRSLDLSGAERQAKRAMLRSILPEEGQKQEELLWNQFKMAENPTKEAENGYKEGLKKIPITVDILQSNLKKKADEERNALNEEMESEKRTLEAEPKAKGEKSSSSEDID